MDFLTDTDFSNKKRRWWVSLFVFMALFVAGTMAELDGMSLGKIKPVGETVARYHMMLLCFALLLAYVVPFALFMRYTCRKMNVSRKLPIVAFFSGWFVPGWIAGDLNDAATGLIKQLTPAWFASMWGDAIEAPIVEETLKVIVVIWLLYLVGDRLRKHYLVAGMGVGMGFQVGEDLTYIENQLSGGHKAFVDAIDFTVNSRIVGSLSSHWCYTAIVAVGIYLIYRRKAIRQGILLILASLIGHGLRNSFIADHVLILDNAVQGASAIISAFVLFVMFRVYVGTFKTLELDEERQGRRDREENLQQIGPDSERTGVGPSD